MTAPASNSNTDANLDYVVLNPGVPLTNASVVARFTSLVVPSTATNGDTAGLTGTYTRVYNYGSGGLGNLLGTQSSAVNFGTSTIGSIYGIYVVLNPGVPLTNASVVARFTSLVVPSTATNGDTAGLTGTYTRVYNYGSGGLGNLLGTQSSAVNFGTSTIGSIYGIYVSDENQSIGNETAAITSSYAIDASSINATTNGTIGTQYGVYDSATNSGTITNGYGLYITGWATGGTHTNTPFDVYAADTGTYNYFAGNVGIGTTSPSAPLTVANNSATGGLLVGSARLHQSGNVSNLFVGDLVDAYGGSWAGYYNTVFGLSAGEYLDVGNGNVAYANSFFGAGTKDTVGYSNTFIGANAGTSTTSGYFNTVTGVNALYQNTSGIYNTTSGGYSLYELTTGSDNTVLGWDLAVASLPVLATRSSVRMSTALPLDCRTTSSSPTARVISALM